MDQVQSEIVQRQLPPGRHENANQIINAINSQLGADNRPQPSNQMNQMQESQQQNSQIPNSERRGRFMSVDTVAVSMLGPNDASR